MLLFNTVTAGARRAAGDVGGMEFVGAELVGIELVVVSLGTASGTAAGPGPAGAVGAAGEVDWSGSCGWWVGGGELGEAAGAPGGAGTGLDGSPAAAVVVVDVAD